MALAPEQLQRELAQCTMQLMGATTEEEAKPVLMRMFLIYYQALPLESLQELRILLEQEIETR